MLLINGEELTDIAENIKLKSSWNNGASIFNFEYSAEKGKGYPNGSTVIFKYNGVDIFYGFLFKTKLDRKKYACTCYDQLRYLKAKNSVLREDVTLSEFTENVCALIGERIKIGEFDNTEIKLGKYFFDNQSHLDMIYQSIKDNLLLNGYYYALFDNFGTIQLKDLYDLRLPLIIGDNSLATEYSYENSIDEDTYNYIKVAKDDKKKGVRDVYVVEDSNSINQYGKLMLYDKVSADLNEAQLKERAKLILTAKNRETENLEITSIGDTRVVAGSGIKVEIAKSNINTWAVVDAVTHEFKRSSHFMKMNLIFGRGLNNE